MLFSGSSEHLRRRQWHPTPVLLPGKSHGWTSLVGCRRVGHNWATSLSLFTFICWRRKWQPTPVFLPGESQGQGSLVGCRLWGCTELDTTKATWRQQQASIKWKLPIIYISNLKTNFFNSHLREKVQFDTRIDSYQSFNKTFLLSSNFWGMVCDTEH